MAKKKLSKKGLAGFVKAVKNAHGAGPIVEGALGVGGGYVATRLGSRIVGSLVERKWPSAARHVEVGAALFIALAVYFATDKVALLKRYQVAGTAGALLGACHTILQTYVPGLAFLLGTSDPAGLGSANFSQQTQLGGSASTPYARGGNVPTTEEMLEEAEDAFREPIPQVASEGEGETFEQGDDVEPMGGGLEDSGWAAAAN